MSRREPWAGAVCRSLGLIELEILHSNLFARCFFPPFFWQNVAFESFFLAVDRRAFLNTVTQFLFSKTTTTTWQKKPSLDSWCRSVGLIPSRCVDFFADFFFFQPRRIKKKRGEKWPKTAINLWSVAVRREEGEGENSNLEIWLAEIARCYFDSLFRWHVEF